MKKMASIRVIDKGTCYDVPGKLRKLARQIERGEWGDATDVVFSLRYQRKGETRIQSFAAGKSNPETLYYMAQAMTKDFMR